MFRNRGGFTILEVMIFLAISGAMLAATLGAVNGQQNRTEFIQGMRDIDSKLEDTLNDVSTGNFTYNNKNCTVPISTPSLTTAMGSTAIGTRSDCVFLGEAIQFNTSDGNNGKYYTYSVLGRRQKKDALGNPIPVTSFDDSNPTAMIDGSGGTQDLSSSYNFEQDITARSISYNSKASGPSPGYTLIGVYTSFDSSSTSSDTAQSLQTYIYKLPDGTAYDPMGGGAPKVCIDTNSTTSGVCPYEKQGGNNTWSVCFLSNNGTKQTAQITITSSATGVDTKLIFNPDATVCPTS